MTRSKVPNGLDFDILRLGIERCDPDLLHGFYAEGAQLRIVNAESRRNNTFELRGKVEIAKHLRAAFGQKMPHRVERGIVDDDRVTYREACDYPDGCRVVVETTLEVRDGKIVRQLDVVANERQANRGGEVGRTTTREPDRR